MLGMKRLEEIICDDRLFSWQEIQFNQLPKSLRFVAITNHLILSQIIKTQQRWFSYIKLQFFPFQGHIPKCSKNWSCCICRSLSVQHKRWGTNRLACHKSCAPSTRTQVSKGQINVDQGFEMQEFGCQNVKSPYTMHVKHKNFIARRLICCK